MQESELIEAVHKIVRANLTSEYRLMLFGSAATGHSVPGSDLDLAIMGPAIVPAHTMAVMNAAVANIPTLRKIDLLDAAAAGPKLQAAIKREAIQV